MPVECPVCRTSNPPGSFACVKCSSPFDLGEVTSPGVEGATGAGVRRGPVSGVALVTGDLLADRYEILKMLGEGGMGTVYKARDLEVDRIVALKVIRPELAGHPEILQRFKQELILSRKVTHRNVIRIFDLGIADDRKFITMDFVEGRDLKSTLVEHGKFTAEKACEIVRQICFGLEAAHNEGVVHRDLKPQNVMLDAQSRVYLMDFGLARSMEVVGMTRTGALVGTPAYMSPEQAKGEKADARTDLFALGVIFYELLTGTLPYQADSMMATLIKRTKELATPPIQVEPSVPPAINDIVMKCLQINPDLRYQHAEEILRDLSFAQPAQSVANLSRSIFDVSSALAPGSQFGPRYRIEAVLGEGGMGKVYKALDSDLNRLVALKLVRPELANDRNSMDRLKQELLLASRVSHKNILRIHDLGDVGGLKFISMAYVDGRDLHQTIAAEGKLPVERAVAITRQLCLALDAAHTENVVHRDLKPQNVLVAKDDQVYVSDFGLAKSLEAQSSMLTTAGEVLGTPRYMSPEQAESKAVDHRTDLYSLGLILYEMVTGDLPFATESAVQTMYQRVTQSPKNPKVLNPGLPEYLVAIILRCLERDPDQRYQNAREILEDLDRQDAPRPSLAAPAPAVAAGGTRLKINARWLAVAALIVLVALVFAVPKSRQAIFALTKGKTSATKANRAGKYVAVLPFRVLGDDPTLEYTSNGIVEAISARLFQLKDVYLASPTAAARVNPKDPIDKVARSLGVKLIVQGTVQGGGDKIAVVVSLDDPATGRRIWTQQFTGLKQDLLTLQDQVYTGLVTALDLKLSNEELAKSTTRLTGNIGAYEMYLKGRSLLRNGQRDEKILKQALDLFDAATQKDANFTLAYTGISDTSLIFFNLKKDSTWAVKALGAANRAQTLNDNLPEVHLALGNVYNATGKTAEAVSELKRALELAPNSDEAYRRLGRVYLSIGQKEEALQALQQAVEANPYYWSNYNVLGAAYLQFGDNEQALKAFQRVTELEPNTPLGWTNVGAISLHEGKWNEAIPAFRRALELHPSAEGYSNLGTAYFYLGKYQEARENFEKAVGLSPNETALVGNLADSYRWLGQQEKARDTYDQAISLGFKALQINPRNAKALSSLALYHAKKGDSTRGLDFIRQARAIDSSDVYLLYNEAVINALANRLPEALKSLQEALTKGYSPGEAISDPELKALRQQPEFQTIVKPFLPKGSAN